MSKADLTAAWMPQKIPSVMLRYRFQAGFCNPAAGNEKGNVENKWFRRIFIADTVENR